MADTLYTYDELISTNYVANANTGGITSEKHRSAMKSVFGCYGQMDTNGVLAPISKNLTGTPSALGGFTVANNLSSDLTLDATAGTITLPSSGAAGVYWVWYEFEVLTNSETGLLEAWVYVSGAAKAATYGSVDVVVAAKRYPFSRGALVALTASQALTFRVNGAGGMATTTGTNFLGTWGAYRVKKT